MKQFVQNCTTALGRLSSLRSIPYCSFALGIASVLLGVNVARGVVSAPDNVVYGSITLDNQPVAATRNDVVVEARRTLNGPALASYRMGSEPRYGAWYSLRIPMEALGPVSDPNASLPGDSVLVVVLDATGLRDQAQHQLIEAGRTTRVDFGTPVPDADGNGLPDIWEVTMLGASGQVPGFDPDRDGRSTGEEFIAGTHPNDPNDVFQVEVESADGLVSVSFLAREASGPAYTGLVRRYALEEKAAEVDGEWTEVPGFTNVVGIGQAVSYAPSANSDPVFHRARVWLESQ